MTHARFRWPLRVRWAEVDAQNIVFNGHYLTYFDVAITEYWRAIGLPYPDSIADTGGDLFVVRSLVNYHAPARFDNEIEVTVRATKLGNSSITFGLEIFHDNALLISGELIYVFAKVEEGKSSPLPDKFRSAIERFDSLSEEQNRG